MARANSTAEIRDYLLAQIPKHPRDVAAVAAKHFGLTRQAVNRHLRSLVQEGSVIARGETRGRIYELERREHYGSFAIAPTTAEDVIWRSWAQPLLTGLPSNVLNICHHGFTEIVNNALEHSEGSVLTLKLVRTPLFVELWVLDDGVGIFRKIRRGLGLEDEKHAVLELAKGKLTTDPRRHSGEGIFFTSRMFDAFAIQSGGLFFNHQPEVDDTSDWLAETARPTDGTAVSMEVETRSKRTTAEVFDKFTTGEHGDYSFNITHVPVALAKYGSENLISRSQAKRLVARFDRFKRVVLNFAGVEEIGQAFADEVFRVFQLEHPDVELGVVNASERVLQMVSRARAGLPPQDATDGTQIGLFQQHDGETN